MSDDDCAAFVAAVEARARRIDTPCGTGTMAWRIWGEDRAGTASLLLSHGAQGAWSHWIRNVEHLAQTRRVIVVDLPGHGDSALPETLDHAGISAALATGLRMILGSDGKADLAGFSLGGVAFAWFAAAHPELVRRLVLIGCGGLATPLGHVDLRSAKGLTGEERVAVLRGNLNGLMLHHPDSADALARHLLITNARKTRLNTAQQLVLPDRLLAALPGIAIPVDAIWGECDRPHPDPAVQEMAIRSIQPHTDFRVIPDAGHWAMYERPEAFDATLIDMLDQPLRAVSRAE